MHTSTFKILSGSQPADRVIPLIRAAATIGFAVAPCSLGFVIIAASEHLIRSIMVGDDPERLISDLQIQFPDDAIEVADKNATLMAQVVEIIDSPEQPANVPPGRRGTDLQMRVRDALQSRDPRSSGQYVR